MDKIATALRYYVSARLSTDPAWQGVQVIISDATVPGEGEHKVRRQPHTAVARLCNSSRPQLMDFIRSQRTQPGYDANTRHCIYGLDADLIMLSMATHELHFSVLREEVDNKRGNVCRRCGQPGHQELYCTGAKKKQDYLLQGTNFQFLDVPILKEYLEAELRPPQPLAFGWDLERACDDFVLLCFLVGNDFLPHIPTLAIREGAIDLLMGLYRVMLPELGGWLSENGNVHFARLGQLVKRVAPLEEKILVNQVEDARESEVRRARNVQRAESELAAVQERQAAVNTEVVASADSAAAEAEQVLQKLKRDRKAEMMEEPVQNLVRLGEAGWRDRYYRVKFKRERGIEDVDYARGVATSFCRGFAWVLQYYYQGVADWEWYYDYHYAPFCSDLAEFVEWDTFEPRLAPRGTTHPFLPLQQLMAVLPPQSAWCLPPCYADLMTAPSSPILDYYPSDFTVDMEGLPAQLFYLGVVQLPFIDSTRLLAALEPHTAALTAEERARNTLGRDFVFAHGAVRTPAVVAMRRCVDLCEPVPFVSDTPDSNLFGSVGPFAAAALHAQSYAAPWPSRWLRDVTPNAALCCFFDGVPPPPQGYVARALPNAVPLPPQLSEEDFQRRQPLARGPSGRLLRDILPPEQGYGGFSGTNMRRSNSGMRRDDPARQWVCAQCTRRNMLSDSNCFVCDLPEASSRSGNVLQWPEWVCPACSRANGPHRWDCEQCKMRKPGMAPRQRRSSSNRDFNTRAFDPEGPSQGSNPYAAPPGLYASRGGGHSSSQQHRYQPQRSPPPYYASPPQMGGPFPPAGVYQPGPAPVAFPMMQQPHHTLPPPPMPRKRDTAPREIHYDRTGEKRSRVDAAAAPEPAEVAAQLGQLQKLQQMQQLLARIRGDMNKE